MIDTPILNLIRSDPVESLIVGLGTYVGGELMVEGEKHNIRYKPLEFNGWTQRHWTTPFEGERYSLVFFTPKGCEGKKREQYIIPYLNSCAKCLLSVRYPWNRSMQHMVENFNPKRTTISVVLLLASTKNNYK